MQSSSSPLITLDRVSRVYTTDDIATHAVDAISLDVHQGEFVAIAGPSGCGKSSLLSILGLLDVATSGSYRLNGSDVTRLSPVAQARARNQGIGFIFQAFNLIGDLTVLENVEVPLIYRRLPVAERKRRAAEALDQVGMGHRATHHPAQLSGGQQQRAAVARAIVGKPPLLLADEPTGNLDSHSGEAVMSLLCDLHRAGTTIVMVTHDPRYTDLAERTIHLFDGRIREESRAPAAAAAR